MSGTIYTESLSVFFVIIVFAPIKLFDPMHMLCAIVLLIPRKQLLPTLELPPITVPDVIHMLSSTVT